MTHFSRALSATLAGALTFGMAIPAMAEQTRGSRAPAVNADGNYNILFVTADQERQPSRHHE